MAAAVLGAVGRVGAGKGEEAVDPDTEPAA
jgi:hypothetical protein